MVAYTVDLTTEEIDRDLVPYYVELDPAGHSVMDRYLGRFLERSINDFFKTVGSNIQPAVYRFRIYGRAGIPLTCTIDRVG